MAFSPRVQCDTMIPLINWLRNSIGSCWTHFSPNFELDTSHICYVRCKHTFAVALILYTIRIDHSCLVLQLERARQPRSYRSALQPAGWWVLGTRCWNTPLASAGRSGTASLLAASGLWCSPCAVWRYGQWYHAAISEYHRFRILRCMLR